MTMWLADQVYPTIRQSDISWWMSCKISYDNIINSMYKKTSFCAIPRKITLQNFNGENKKNKNNNIASNYKKKMNDIDILTWELILGHDNILNLFTGKKK